MHPTLLPEGRGRASIPRAILKDLAETGVTMFVLDDGVDTGPILGATRIPLSASTTATELYGKVKQAHRTLIREHWRPLSEGALKAVPQNPLEGSVWPGRSPADGLILPEMSVGEALRLVRATTHPYPGAYWQCGNTVIRVWEAVETESPGVRPWVRCRDGIVEAVRFDRESVDDAS